MYKIKRKILRNLKNTYCRLGHSKIHGIGVIAVRDIPKGKNPFWGIKNSKYYKFRIRDLKKLDAAVMKMLNDFFVIEGDGTVDITENALNGMDISFFLNNSKNPNLKIFDDKINDSYSFRTTKKIKRGEELTISYANYELKKI